MIRYHNNNTNWKRYFAYLKFLRWYKFYQYFFMFLFLVISTYYFFNKQIHYVRKEWSIYDCLLSTSTFTLKPYQKYYVSWDNEAYYLVYIIINGEAVGSSSIGNFFISGKEPTDMKVHIFPRKSNPLNLGFSVREIKVEEVDFVDKDKYLSVDTLKYFIQKHKNNK